MVPSRNHGEALLYSCGCPEIDKRTARVVRAVRGVALLPLLQRRFDRTGPATVAVQIYYLPCRDVSDGPCRDKPCRDKTRPDCLATPCLLHSWHHYGIAAVLGWQGRPDLREAFERATIVGMDRPPSLPGFCPHCEKTIYIAVAKLKSAVGIICVARKKEIAITPDFANAMRTME